MNTFDERKTVIRLLAAAATTVLTLGVAAPAHAEMAPAPDAPSSPTEFSPPPAPSHPMSKRATKWEGFTCGIPASFVEGMRDDLTSTDTREVLAASGISTMICRFTLPDYLSTSRAVSASGFGCNTASGYSTRDTTLRATPAGQLVLTCKLKTAAA